MALEDAMSVSRHLAATSNPAVAFQNYQKERYLRTCRVQLTARVYGEVYHAAGATRDLRNAYLTKRTPDQGIESLAWLYDPI